MHQVYDWNTRVLSLTAKDLISSAYSKGYCNSQWRQRIRQNDALSFDRRCEKR